MSGVLVEEVEHVVGVVGVTDAGILSADQLVVFGFFQQEHALPDFVGGHLGAQESLGLPGVGHALALAQELGTGRFVALLLLLQVSHSFPLFRVQALKVLICGVLFFVLA